MQKTTEELENELQAAKSPQDYLSANEGELLHLSMKDYLAQLLAEKGLTRAQVITASGLNEIYAYQIFAGQKRPSREKLLCLSLGMNLTATETQRLLRLAGHSELYARVRRDSVILFGIENGLPLLRINELLFEQGEAVLE